jgi:hypothetical protein
VAGDGRDELEEVRDAADGARVASLSSSATGVEDLKPNVLSYTVDDGSLKIEPITPDSLGRYRRLMTD